MNWKCLNDKHYIAKKKNRKRVGGKVHLAQNRGHLVGQGARDNDEVALARGRTGHGAGGRLPVKTMAAIIGETTADQNAN